MLWFIQHYLWNLSRAPDIRQNELDAWELGYLVANQRFAEVVAQELSRRPDATVMLHDYHLYTAPGVIRQAHPDAFLHFFVHIPWSQPDYWRVVPNHIREAVLEGLLANDIIAFHTARYARNFLLCCEDLLGLRVDYEQRQVQWQGRDVWVRSYPISVNAPRLRDDCRLARGPRRGRSDHAAPARAPDRPRRPCRPVEERDPRLSGVRRLPRPVSGVRRGNHVPRTAPALPPGRCPNTSSTLRRSGDVVSRINTKHGNTDWMPIDLRVESNMARAVAAYKHYDVLMVNAIYDGMNLVAKEGPLINERDGVMILSENTGAHEELGSFAVSVNPFDIENQAEASIGR